jgi:histidyl-tRNA synthetase
MSEGSKPPKRQPLKAIKGTHDILPGETAAWHRVEGLAREHFARYGYREIRTPVFEETELFARGIGEDTDVVSKEMYTFGDRDGGSLTLRPEATAGIVRSVIEHNLSNVDPLLRVWAMGPMFRRERPQKGRQRQFHQVDVEAFGVTAPGIDAEIVEMGFAFLERCGLSGLELILNSVGDAEDRQRYAGVLREALRVQASALCADCQRRTETNPLRVLDCKVPSCQPVIEALPKIADHLGADARDHFAEVCRQLTLLGIPYRTSHRLVRGLDYYTRTTFEIVATEGLGSQSTVLGGGRYDGLVRDLGGPDLCGIGFALGVERLLLLAPPAGDEPRCDVFLMPLAAAAGDPALMAQKLLRNAGVRAVLDHGFWRRREVGASPAGAPSDSAASSAPAPVEGRSFKSRMKLADKLGARFVAILGDDELAQGAWSVRDMKTSSQEPVPLPALVEHVKGRL